MKRRGQSGPTAYGLGGLVPRAPASPAGKFLNAYGGWSEAAGGSGVTQHTGLSLLGWTVSGHTGGAGRVAGFGPGTGTTEFVVGTDLMAYDAGVNSLTSADSAAGLAYPNAANVWTRLPLVANVGIYATSVSALSTFGLTSYARTLLDDATPAEARTTLEIAQTALGQAVWEVRAPVAAGNYPTIGSTGAAGYFGQAPTSPIPRGGRWYGVQASASATPADAATIGGWNIETHTSFQYATSNHVFTSYLFFGTTSTVAIRGHFCLSNANVTDVNKGANNSFGLCWRPAMSDFFNAYSTDNAGNSTFTPLTVALAADTLYVVRVSWSGTAVSISLATVGADGVFGTWETVVISANLPTTTLALAPTGRMYVVGSPGAKQVVHFGGAVTIAKAA